MKPKDTETPSPTSCNFCTPNCAADSGPDACERHTYRNDKEIKLLLNRCNRIEGQIRGIKGMLEKNAYCDDIIHQIAAAQSALESLSRVILERHMKSCLISRVQDGDTAVVDELIVTIGKMRRL